MARPRATEYDAVLDAAVRQLILHGIAATTVDGVAADAGVSRATVYRYLGGKREIVQAVIIREAGGILDRAGAAIATAPTLFDAIAAAVATTLTGVAESPLLARLTTTDLVDTLPHVTVDSAPLVAIGVAALEPAFRAAPSFAVDEDMLGEAIEEAARFVFSQLTTPRGDGRRLAPAPAGRRAAALIESLVAP